MCGGGGKGVGLDPQFGFLHALRPGRPSLALDLVEEFRSCVADRLALTLINRRHPRRGHFDEREGGSVLLNETGRRLVSLRIPEAASREVGHSLMKEKVPVGLLPHLQARLLARHLRGDMPGYVRYWRGRMAWIWW